MRSCFDTLTRRRTAASVQLQIFIFKKHTCALKWRSVEALPIVYFIKNGRNKWIVAVEILDVYLQPIRV